MVNVPALIPKCDFHSPALLDLFISSDASVCSAVAFPPLGNSDYIFVSVFIEFASDSKGDAACHQTANDCSGADWDDLHEHLRDVPWKDILKRDAFAAATEFCEWVQVEIYVYIPHSKYLVKSHLFSWLPAACAAAKAHRNQFFHLYQYNKSFASKVKFRQVSNCCNRVLKAAKLAYANKTKEAISFKKRGSHNFWRIANSNLRKGKSAILPLFNGTEMLSSASDKAKLFAKNFSQNSKSISLSLHLVFLLGLI